MSNGKAMILHLRVRLIKNTLHKMTQYFPRQNGRFDGNVTVELDFSNYVTKADLEGAAEVDTSNIEAKTDLASLMAEIDDRRRQIKDILC